MTGPASRLLRAIECGLDGGANEETTLRRVLLAVSSLTLVITAGVSPAAAAPGPNHSILLLKPGVAVTGTLQAGVFAKKRTFKLKGGWTHAAAGRDTLALYDRNNGKLRTGHFRNGVFTSVKTVKVGTIYRRMIASCDTLLLYAPATGRILTAFLDDGRARNQTIDHIEAGWDLMASTCDTAMFVETSPGNQAVVWGPLDAGGFTPSGSAPLSSVGRFAATGSSWFAYDIGAAGPCTPRCGSWGAVNATTGLVFGGLSPEPLIAADIVAGTASSILLYRRDGASRRARLVNGTLGTIRASRLPKGLTIIAGGR